jgi:hypothetical protein
VTVSLERQRQLSLRSKPHPESSDPDHDGRRIERVPGSWIVLNVAKHWLEFAGPKQDVAFESAQSSVE